MINTTTAFTTTTPQYGLCGSQYLSGSIMGINAMSTSTTAQSFTTTRYPVIDLDLMIKLEITDILKL